VASEHPIEDSLRELLRDPVWSLPAWPDPMAVVTRTARKQRIRTVAAAAVTAAAAVAAVAAAAAVLPAQERTPPEAAPVVYALPPPGSAGFPVSIYPTPARLVRSLGERCPNPAGVQRPPATMASKAAAVIDGLGRSFSSDLRRSDRTYWPQVRASWLAAAGNSAAPVRVGHRGQVHVLYAGRLESHGAGLRAAGLAGVVRAGCGHRTAADTWLIVTGQASKPGLQREFLLLDRRGHVLVWNAS
jgi:hypothetical protein